MKKAVEFLFAVASVLCLGGCGREAASVGVIGGADGPTAVFITSNINWMGAFGLLGAAGAVLLAAFVIRHRKK